MDKEHLIEFGKKEKLDTKDKKILEILQKNARTPLSQIARKTGIPRDSITYRLKRLEKLKVIRFHHTLINPAKLGYPLYTAVQFSLSNFDEKKEEEFIRFYCFLTLLTYFSYEPLRLNKIERGSNHKRRYSHVNESVDGTWCIICMNC